QDVFTSLYRIRNKPFSRFVNFWTKSLPLEAWRLRKDMLVALLIFLASCFIGVISTANDIEYAKVILGSDYVEMTDKHINDWLIEQENIKASAKPGSPEYEAIKNGGFTGSPLKVYESHAAWPMFSYIFFNNIKVAFYMFVLGLTLGIGTLFMTMQNGIMLGTFQSYFYYKGLILGKNLLYASFLTIWIHGAFEISAIVIAGACGFALARSLMFPGTMTRLQSLQAGAKRGLKVFIGLAVFIFFAAILESWVTRQYNMPEWEKLLIILGSFIVIVAVFVFIPFMVARKYKNEVEVEDNPTYVPEVNFNLYTIRNTADMMTDTFRLYRRHYATTFSVLYKVILPLSFIFLYFNYTLENVNYYNDENPWYINVCMVFGSDPYHWILPTIYWPCITGVFLAHIFYHVQKKEDPDFNIKNYWSFMLVRSIELAVLFAPISLIYQYTHPALMILVMFLFPIYLPALFAVAHGQGNFLQRVGHGMSTGASGYGNGIAIYFFI
ncbi:MAG TPA: stage II sporulation protein M, partial [Flavobacteriales bacterium]|nr:stage II sporulation protein M [Flavobacteriales bacterium]